MTDLEVTDIIAGRKKLETKIKVDFATKVYSILSLQLATTVGVVCIVMFPENNRKAILNHPVAALSSTFILAIIVMGAALMLRRGPWALLALAAFTGAMSVMVSIPCALYYEEGHGNFVLVAFLITLILFATLSVIGWIFGQHFRGCGPFLLSSLWILILWGLVNAIFGWHVGFLYSMFGAVIFSIYVIYDTNQLVEKHSQDNDYVAASLELYLDIINLFLHILELLKDCNCESD